MSNPRKPRPKKDAVSSVPTPTEAETANILTQAGLVDLRALTDGQTVNLPIVMAPSQPRLFADTVAVSHSFSGFIDLTLLTLRQNLVSQSYVVTSRNENGATLAGGALTGGPLVMEEGTVRISTTTALRLATVIISQLRALGIATGEEIEEAIKSTEKVP